MLKSKTFLFIAIFFLLVLHTSYSQQSAAVSQLSPQPGQKMPQYLDSLLTVSNSIEESQFTVPSFTRLRRAMISAHDSVTVSTAQRLAFALKNLKSSDSPYSIVANINGDPTTEIAFNWFTNEGVTDGRVEIVEGIVKTPEEFAKPLVSVKAKVIHVKDLNYCAKSNGLLELAGLQNNTKMDFESNKANVKGLKPEKLYSYRVGKEASWSDIGTFRTAGKNLSVSFIYTTDPQANNDGMFNISQTTTHAAQEMYPDVDFWLHCGDLIESSGPNNSEWEWEQFFMTQQDIFLKNSFAPVMGNHDKSPNHNFAYHFNTDSTAFDYELSANPGSVYSFVYGNALFFALSFEDYMIPGYLDAMSKWMHKEVEAYPEVKWKIAYYHKTIYTGSASHQDDNDGKIVRDVIAPLFDSLKIDLALQGHDHVYEVIGPVKNKKLVPGAVIGQTRVASDSRENLTGLKGGIFNVKEGTLYFLNNSSGRKKYEPRTKEQMKGDEARLGVNNYFSLFTGRFGQTGRPTFSNVSVSRDNIHIKTYEILDDMNPSLFDEFQIVK